MKNKLLLLCVMALAALGLVGCQKERPDIYETSATIAQKSLQGIYVYVDVDSTAMATTMYEWKLTESAKDGKTGYYRVASTGNGLDGDNSVALTWETATMAANHLSLTIPAKLDGEDIQLLWESGVLVFDEYSTTKYMVSLGDLMRTLNTKFANVTFTFNDTVNYLTYTRDTIYYLAWKTEVVNFKQDSIDAYKQYLVDMADTLKWFNETYPKQAVPDTVRFSTKPQGDGTYKGVIPRAFETSRVEVDTTNHGPLEIINSELVCNRSDELVNSASYTRRHRKWTEEFYTKPTSLAAEYYDSLYVVSDAKWTISSVTNAKKFDVIMKGNTNIKVYGTEAGEVVRNDDTTDPAAFSLLPISAYTAEDGVLTLFDKKYKLKQ